MKKSDIANDIATRLGRLSGELPLKDRGLVGVCFNQALLAVTLSESIRANAWGEHARARNEAQVRESELRGSYKYKRYAKDDVKRMAHRAQVAHLAGVSLVHVVKQEIEREAQRA